MTKKKQRLLFLGFNKEYVNPYRKTILSILGSIFDLVCYGPGFSTKKDLELGVNSWLKTEAAYDYVMIDNDVALLVELKKKIKSKRLFLMSVIHFKPGLYLPFAREFNIFFSNTNLKKIILANWDGYNISNDAVEYVKKTKAYIIDFGGFEIFFSVRLINKYYPFKKLATNDNWRNFLKKNKERVICAPHTINATEFFYKPLELRNIKFSVIGVGYPERKEAAKIITLRQKIAAFLNKIRLYVRLKLKIRVTNKGLTAYKAIYFQKISNTQLTYCSGGPVLYPVRKYFEIPAHSSVAIGPFCGGFKELGFVDGLNFIVSQNNAEIKKVLDTYTIEKLQAIANNGYNLIWNKHSDWARLIQLSNSFSLIEKGTFKGSYWKSGKYKHR